MVKKQTHHTTILEIMNEYGNNQSASFKTKDIISTYSQLLMEGNTELCIKLFPYLEFDKYNQFKSSLLLFQDNPKFKDVLYPAIINNLDIVEKVYDYQLYKICEIFLPNEQLKLLKDTLFSSFLNPRVEQNDITTISFDFNPISLYKCMSLEIFTNIGTSLYQEFLKFIRYNESITKQLQVELVFDYEIENNCKKIIFVNAKDKELIKKFMQATPLIFQDTLALMMPMNNNNCYTTDFKPHEHVFMSHIEAIKLDCTLKTKNNLPNRSIKI